MVDRWQQAFNIYLQDLHVRAIHSLQSNWLLVFGLWEETEQIPHRHGKNMQIPHVTLLLWGTSADHYDTVLRPQYTEMHVGKHTI